MVSTWSCDTTTDRYDEHNYVVHNGERGLLVSYIPVNVVEQLAYGHGKPSSRWVVYMLRGLYPDFAFDSDCTRIGAIRENSSNPDKLRALEVALDFAKRRFLAGRFSPGAKDIARDPRMMSYASSGMKKEAIHGMADAFDTRGWSPVSSPSELVRARPEFGGGTLDDARKRFDLWQNEAKIGNAPGERNDPSHSQDLKESYKAFQDRAMAFGWSRGGDDDTWIVVAMRCPKAPEEVVDEINDELKSNNLDAQARVTGPKGKKQLTVLCGSHNASLRVVDMFKAKGASCISSKMRRRSET
jgi:hypothetical protein